jgi:ribokinase
MNIDYVYEVPRFAQAGETLAALSMRVFPGGKGLNQSVALAKAGGAVAHAGMVGSEGVWLIDLLNASGADTRLIETSQGANGHAIIQVTPDGGNSILLHPGANGELDAAFIDRALREYGKGDILVLQNETSGVAYAMSAAYERGMRVAFNPSPITEAVKTYPLEAVAWFILNETEGYSLSGRTEPREILSALGERYPRATVVLTLGENGSLCREAGGRVYEQSAHKPPEVVDTTAAGDTFAGFFIAAAAAGKGIRECLRLASVAAGISVSRKGAAVSVPTAAEVEGV